MSGECSGWQAPWNLNHAETRLRQIRFKKSRTNPWTKIVGWQHPQFLWSHPPILVDFVASSCRFNVSPWDSFNRLRIENWAMAAARSRGTARPGRKNRREAPRIHQQFAVQNDPKNHGMRTNAYGEGMRRWLMMLAAAAWGVFEDIFNWGWFFDLHGWFIGFLYLTVWAHCFLLFKLYGVRQERLLK